MSAPRAAAREVVVATSNPGKLREIRAILAGARVRLRCLADFPDVRLPEEGDDYADNAAAKARAVARQTGRVSLADDSGLEVVGLAGGPGACSARYGGPGLDDADRAAHLLRALEGVEGDGRRARFVCLAALATPSGEVLTARGECEGRILHAPRGRGGFGYDPVFEPRGRGVAMAELPAAEKQRISHRARAFGALRDALTALAERAASGAAGGDAAGPA